MKTWIVNRECSGWKRRYWKEGTVVELDDNEVPPRNV